MFTHISHDCFNGASDTEYMFFKPQSKAMPFLTHPQTLHFNCCVIMLFYEILFIHAVALSLTDNGDIWHNL